MTMKLSSVPSYYFREGRREHEDILKSHLDYFPENLGAYSEDHGERFHQDIKTMKQGPRKDRILSCWQITVVPDKRMPRSNSYPKIKEKNVSSVGKQHFHGILNH